MFFKVVQETLACLVEPNERESQLSEPVKEPREWPSSCGQEVGD